MQRVRERRRRNLLWRLRWQRRRTRPNTRARRIQNCPLAVFCHHPSPAVRHSYYLRSIWKILYHHAAWKNLRSGTTLTIWPIKLRRRWHIGRALFMSLSFSLSARWLRFRRRFFLRFFVALSLFRFLRSCWRHVFLFFGRFSCFRRR